MSREEQPAKQEDTVTITADAPATEITRGETLVIGSGQYYTSGRFPTATWITVLGEPFLEICATLYVPCGWCDTTRPGIKSGYGHVFDGVCFQCMGRGFNREAGTVEAATKIVKRRIADRARRARQAAEKSAADTAEGLAWRATNADLAGMLDAIYAQVAEGYDETDGRAAYAAADAAEMAWGGFVIRMTHRVAANRALTEKQTAAVTEAIEDAVQQQAAEAARRSAQRYFGQEKDKVAATGTVVVAKPIECMGFRYAGDVQMKMLVIIEGTGEFTGVTFKIFGTGATLWGAERGQDVEVRGAVKGHEEYEGTLQTELTRAKIAAA